MSEVSFDEWKRLDLRIGKIKEVKDHPNADKLIILKVDVGDKEMQLVAGLKEHYKNKELVGKKVIIFVNLRPTELRGVKSDGMILAAVDKEKVVLIVPEKDIKVGAKVE